MAVKRLSPRDLASYKQLDLLAQSVVEGFLTGLHRSPYKGFAIEFSEHREYVPGDDLKHLDWKLLGKLDKHYIKQYEEDTSMRCYLVLDSSGSMGYQSGDYSKLDYGRFACGVFSYLMLMQSDAIGLVNFDSKINHYIPPRSSKPHFKHILDTIEGIHAGEDTGIGNVLHALANKLNRRALIIIISDFFDDINDIRLALNHFSHKHHEVIVCQTIDRKEVNFPFTNMTRFESLEVNEQHLVDPIRIKQAYTEQFQAHQQAIIKTCKNLNIDYLQMVTDMPFDRTLASFLQKRQRK